MEKWIEFYKPYFEDEQKAKSFVEELEPLTPLDARYRSKIIMHQTQRLVSLAEEVENIRPKKDALKLFFLIVCSENVAKLHDNYEDENKSKFYVKKFFIDHVSQADQITIEKSFQHQSFRNLSLTESIELLYKVRCDLAHEGNYWGFRFAFDDMSNITGDPPITVSIKYFEFRDIVVKGGISAAKSYI
jgi:hypothetical protein